MQALYSAAALMRSIAESREQNPLGIDPNVGSSLVGTIGLVASSLSYAIPHRPPQMTPRWPVLSSRRWRADCMLMSCPPPTHQQVRRRGAPQRREDVAAAIDAAAADRAAAATHATAALAASLAAAAV